MTARQAAARAAFARLARHPALRGARPVLAGTFPLGLDVATSDLDVICEVNDLALLELERATDAELRRIPLSLRSEPPQAPDPL
ncbi:DUF4269 domain-containing protein [Oceanithermus sp.]|uniref:DUF4269 domain-containing protein n=1 Tax=Oceanithermus sp. TaxID=2268145 RepID=UPI0025E2834A|nr:DUF4269 domain-containing protein [Oceanithermus sp.]